MATAIVAGVGVAIAGVGVLGNFGLRGAGSARLSSIDVPAPLRSEANSLQTSWARLTEPLAAHGSLAWDTNRTEAMADTWDVLGTAAKYWDISVSAMRGIGSSEQATIGHRISLYQLHYCFRLVQKECSAALDSGLLIRNDPRNATFCKRVNAALAWLDQHYPIACTRHPYVLKSVAWSSDWAGLRASGRALEVLAPGRPESFPIIYGAGPNSTPGYALMKHQQGGLPEVLSCPRGLKTTWWRNNSMRTRACDFAPWDLWHIEPAFDGAIPGVRMPGKLELRVCDCVKLKSAWDKQGGKVICRDFAMNMVPRLGICHPAAHEHETTTFVVSRAH